MAITINSTACTQVTLDASWRTASCVAPSGSGHKLLEVLVTGQADSITFTYDAPTVVIASPFVVDSMSEDTVLTVSGCSVCLAHALMFVLLNAFALLLELLYPLLWVVCW